MLTPRDINHTPPNMWRYRHPTTGYLIEGAYSMSRLYAMVKDYCKANNLPDIPNLERELVAYICNAEPTYCESTEPPSYAQRAKTFARAMTDWMAGGLKSVTHEQYEQRLEICKICPYWRGQGALGFGSCGKCGCSGLKLYLPTQACPDGRWNAIK